MCTANTSFTTAMGIVLIHSEIKTNLSESQPDSYKLTVQQGNNSIHETHSIFSVVKHRGDLFYPHSPGAGKVIGLVLDTSREAIKLVHGKIKRT